MGLSNGNQVMANFLVSFNLLQNLLYWMSYTFQFSFSTLIHVSKLISSLHCTLFFKSTFYFIQKQKYLQDDGLAEIKEHL